MNNAVGGGCLAQNLIRATSPFSTNAEGRMIFRPLVQIKGVMGSRPR
jgi:hypothetical protein